MGRAKGAGGRVGRYAVRWFLWLRMARKLFDPSHEKMAVMRCRPGDAMAVGQYGIDSARPTEAAWRCRVSVARQWRRGS